MKILNFKFKQTKFLAAFFLTILVGNMWATVTVTHNGTPLMGSPYATLAAAVTDINALGTLSGPVVADVSAGHTETLAGTIILTATGTVTNTITIQKSGTGANPLLTAYAGTVSAASTYDAMFVLSGSDYVTIDGIDLAESVANTTAATQMEIGYGLFRLSDIDGCNNNIIKNCSITGLGKANTTVLATGIISLNVSWAAPATAIVPTSLSGTNSNNTFTLNIITGGSCGINDVGYNDATLALCNQNNVYSYNTISDYGNTVTGSGSVHGIVFNGQNNWLVSNNTITSGGSVKSSGTINGIFNSTPNSGGNGSVLNNTITIHGGGANSNLNCIRVQGGISSATINIKKNTIQNCTYTTATSGAFFAILNTGFVGTINIDSNTITNNNIVGSASYSGVISLISVTTNAPTNVNIRANSITNNSNLNGTSTAATGAVRLIECSVGTNNVISDNIIDGYTRQNSVNTNTAGNYTGIFTVGGGSAKMYIKRNTVQNMAYNGAAGTGSILIGIQTGTSSDLQTDSNNINTITNNKTTGTSLMYGIFNSASPTSDKYRYNTISNISSAGTSTVYGISVSTTTSREISYNTINNIKSTKSGISVGLSSGSGNSPVIKNNTIYDIGVDGTGTSATYSAGLFLVSVSGGAAEIYNNIISDIKANGSSTNVSAAQGININAAANVRYNTIYLNNSANTTLVANAGTAGINIVTTSAAVNISNNIINNQYVSSGTGVGRAIGFSTSGTNGTRRTNATFANNIYSINPGTNNFVFAEGVTFSSLTNSYFISGVTAGTGKIEDKNLNTSCSVYKKFNLDTFSYTEDNLSGTFNTYAPSGASYAKSGAVSIGTITTDYAGTTRASTSDIGALEFSGSTIPLATPLTTILAPATVVTTRQCRNGSWIYYANATTPQDFVFAMDTTKATSLALDTVTILVGTNSSYSGTNGTNLEHGMHLMGRAWNVKGTLASGDTVKVKFFYNPVDTSTLFSSRNTAFNALPTSSLAVKNTQLEWFKTVGTPYDASFTSGIVGNKFPSTVLKLTPIYGVENTINYVQFNDITSFSGGTAGFSFGPPNTGGTNALPVTWAGFDVTSIALENVLKWKTASERNTSYYQVEYSYDGLEFETIAERIPAAGNSTDLKTYTVTHADLSPVVYYRILQVDLDGKQEYSPTRMAKRTAITTPLSVTLFPIPLGTSKVLTVRILSSTKAPLTYKVTDMMGRIIAQENYTMNKSLEEFSISTETLGSGIYSLEVTNGAETIVKRFVK